MKSIGVRELRQRASECLRQVEAGRTLEVTTRGRLVALLVPVRHTGHRQRLLARGRMVAGAGDLLDLGPPLPPARDVPLPSDLLVRARTGER
ncbi:MAG: prevent-host-death family protein [Acidobacteria bacterium RIFCSPLOWO2_02_FULL_65_29]|nr:MAG: prevent-host-death family protein [Acidobacteria bacterium RIFCSPLOWO2_02_FULL_65_29]